MKNRLNARHQRSLMVIMIFSTAVAYILIILKNMLAPYTIPENMVKVPNSGNEIFHFYEKIIFEISISLPKRLSVIKDCMSKRYTIRLLVTTFGIETPKKKSNKTKLV